MFVREKKNRSGSFSVQILLKDKGRNKLVKSVGSVIEESEIAVLVAKAQEEIRTLSKQRSIFVHEKDVVI